MENEVNVTPEVTDGKETTPLKYENLEEANQKIRDLESNIVKHKKEKKETTPTSSVSEQEIERIVEKRDYMKSNPELAEFKTQIDEYTSKGLSLQEASTLVKQDPTFVNRKKAENMSISGGESSNKKTTYTTAEIEKLSQADYNKVMSLQAKGEVTFK